MTCRFLLINLERVPLFSSIVSDGFVEDHVSKFFCIFDENIFLCMRSIYYQVASIRPYRQSSSELALVKDV